MVDITIGAAGANHPAEVKDVELYHPKSWVTKYVFSQDAKVIAIQYSITALSIGLAALVLSWLMRLQLAFPSSFSVIGPGEYLQFITMHGMIMVIYLLTALFLRSEEHTSELQSRGHLVCRLLLEKKKSHTRISGPRAHTDQTSPRASRTQA